MEEKVKEILAEPLIPGSSIASEGETNVKRIYWNDEHKTLVYELESGRRICLSRVAKRLIDIEANEEIIFDMEYKDVIL